MIETEFNPPISSLLQDLATLSEDLQDKAMRSGLTASAKPLKDKLKQNAPDDTGALAKSIGHITLSKSAKARIGYQADQRVILVGPVRKVSSTVNGVTRRQSQGRKAIWLEEGTEPHVIKPRNSSVFKSLKISLSRGSIFVDRINHPGARATHFMQRSYEQTQSLVNEHFYRGLARYLDKKRAVTA